MTGVRKEFSNLSNKDRKNSRVLLLDKNGALLPDFTGSTVEPEHFISLFYKPGINIEPLTGVQYQWSTHEIPVVARFIDIERYDDNAVAEHGNVFLRDLGSCYLTGIDLIHPNQYSVDHIIPLAKGGAKKDMSNMAIAHSTVNFKKSDMTVAEFKVNSGDLELELKEDIPEQMPIPKIEELFLQLWKNYRESCHPEWLKFVDIVEISKNLKKPGTLKLTG